MMGQRGQQLNVINWGKLCKTCLLGCFSVSHRLGDKGGHLSHEALVTCFKGKGWGKVRDLSAAVFLKFLQLKIAHQGAIFWGSLFFGCAGSLKAARGLSLVAASGGYSSLGCTGFSLRWLLLLQSAGFSSCSTWGQQLRRMGSVVVACGLSCRAACWIFPYLWTTR